MLKTLSKLLLLCVLVSCCAGEEKIQGPFKPVSPVPLNPELTQIMSAIKSGQMPYNPYASSLTMKMMMEEKTTLKPSEMPEISRVMCSCESSLELEKCLEEPQKKIENIEEIKTITKKLEKMLNKHVFKSAIVKRSIEQIEEQEKELVANGKDAKHDIKLMLNIYETIKSMLEIKSDKDVETFKSKLMSMPEKEMTLKELVEELKAPKSETCEHEEHTIECTEGTKLKIIKAAITNKNKYVCPAVALAKNSQLKAITETTESCYEEEMTTKLMNSTCSGKQECTVSVHRDFLNICKCAAQKYLELTYTCEIESSEVYEKSLDRSKRSLFGAFHHPSVERVRQRTLDRFTTRAYDGFYDLAPYDGVYPLDTFFGGYPYYDYYGYGYGYGGYGFY